MNGGEVLDVARDAIWTIVLVSSPLMLVGLVVGVVISLVQALTQIQEMTLAFGRREILAIFVTLLLTTAVHGRHPARSHDAAVGAHRGGLGHAVVPQHVP